MFHLFTAFAGFGHSLISERLATGREATRTRGRFGGRPEKFKESNIQILKTLVDNGTPINTIEEKWNVSRSTRYLEKEETHFKAKK